jgi:hypothetical protein
MRLVFEFFRGSNDFIVEKVYLLNRAECKAACHLHLIILNQRNISIK